MTEEQSQLWIRIDNFELDHPGSSFSFSDRLARENSWSLDYALRVIDEYKKFMFLICVADHPLTPSDQVDQAWHLHLLYTRSYWEDFCDKTIGQKIHHGPTRGREERSKFKDWYAATKNLYLQKFNGDPPADIWPSSEKRFGEINFVRVNKSRNWILSKPKFP